MQIAALLPDDHREAVYLLKVVSGLVDIVNNLAEPEDVGPNLRLVRDSAASAGRDR